MKKILTGAALGMAVSACASTPSGATAGSGAGGAAVQDAAGTSGATAAPTGGSSVAGSGIGGSGIGGSGIGGSGIGGSGGIGGVGSLGASGSGGDSSSAGSGALAGGASGTNRPCDTYAAANAPCVGAHSTVRALYAAYDGRLYQVRRESDKTTKDISALGPGGLADADRQDEFCAGTSCTISIIYDQSPQGNHLPVSPPVHWLPNGGKEAGAGAAKIMIAGHHVYGVLFPADSTFTYRNNATKGVATGDQPESMYMVVDGHRFNGRCCFDYGNVETTGNDDGAGTMETLTFSNISEWSHGAGTGPCVMSDLENGVFAGGGASVPTNTPRLATYVTLMLKGPAGNHYTLKDGDSQMGALAIKWDGARPNGYSPMKKEGALELGVGGDGSSGGTGIFFEGAVTAGNPPDIADDAVQADIVAVGYGR